MEPVPRNADVEKLKDPEFSKKTDWINALERDFPGLPNYFADLIVSYCLNNPEEAELVMNNGGEGPKTDLLNQWKEDVKKQNITVQ